MSFAYCQDRFVPVEEAKVSIFNRGFLYGDGVFTTLRVENGKIFYLKEHSERLRKQCEFIFLDFPEIKETLIHQLVHLNHADHGFWRLKIMVTALEDMLSGQTTRGRKSELFMTLVPYEGSFCTPVRLAIYPYPYQSALAKIKSLAYLERLRIKEFALSHGYDDALVLDPNGCILETGVANIFWKDRHGIHVPDVSLPYYFGVTLEQAIKIAENWGCLSFTKKPQSFLPNLKCICAIPCSEYAPS